MSEENPKTPPDAPPSPPSAPSALAQAEARLDALEAKFHAALRTLITAGNLHPAGEQELAKLVDEAG